ncbi:uncharacterized protein BDZ99DRAFT_514456 [Mytilinidion resinicola]|uniref:Uncharacterized protein n=1 Tax=Mytilinidion resinicola TaxID=574789 RepID=A0A6A6Z3T2_9PEZI|nr:uncharacterized protein BDZ99DRAFT_514456 [Mytilinidion resinicola]KAF2815812.1 hypothetical protein BDZ99DRAFT_514456 [Mytilinidion resinicola]
MMLADILEDREQRRAVTQPWAWADADEDETEAVTVPGLPDSPPGAMRALPPEAEELVSLQPIDAPARVRGAERVPLGPGAASSGNVLPRLPSDDRPALLPAVPTAFRHGFPVPVHFCATAPILGRPDAPFDACR